MPDSKSLQNVAPSGHAPPGGGVPPLALGAALSLVLGAPVGTVALLAVALITTLAEGELLAVADALGGGALAVGVTAVTELLAAALRLGAELATGPELATPGMLALGLAVVAEGDTDGSGVSEPGGVGLQAQSAKLKLTRETRTERVRKRGPHD